MIRGISNRSGFIVSQPQPGKDLGDLIARGLYAKTKISSATGKIIPAKPLPVLAKEGLTKIGVRVVPSRAEQAYNSGKTTQVPTGRVIAIKGKRVSRKIGYNGHYILLERAAR